MSAINHTILNLRASLNAIWEDSNDPNILAEVENAKGLLSFIQGYIAGVEDALNSAQSKIGDQNETKCKNFGTNADSGSHNP